MDISKMACSIGPDGSYTYGNFGVPVPADVLRVKMVNEMNEFIRSYSGTGAILEAHIIEQLGSIGWRVRVSDYNKPSAVSGITDYAYTYAHAQSGMKGE